MKLELSAEYLLKKLDETSFPFKTTAEIKPDEELLTQSRAKQSIEFGVGMPFSGYNIYALGSTQSNKRKLITKRLEHLVNGEKSTSDWCYISNFEEPEKPKSIKLPPGLGRKFRRDMQIFIKNVRVLIPASLSSDEFQNQKQEIANALQLHRTNDATELEQEAKNLNLTMLPTPKGFIFAPVDNDKVIEQDAYLELSTEQRKEIQNNIEHMADQLQEKLREYPKIQQKLIEDQRSLIQKSAEQVISTLMSNLHSQYEDYTRIIDYFAAVKHELLENVEKIMELDAPQAPAQMFSTSNSELFLDSFNVNLIVDSTDSKGPPVLYESNPSLDSLVGKLEHRIEFGMPVTDFNLIRPGALHRANGGYLLLDAERLLQKPFAWDALKRSISDQTIRIESVSQMMNMTYSVSLEPEPIPLDVKIILLGSNYLYHLLRNYDADFDQLFKVVADFDDDVEWSPQNVTAYTSIIASTVKEFSLKALDAAAVARVIEHASRLVADQKRLSTHVDDIGDLLKEADFLATQDDLSIIARKHISKAIEQRVFRLGRYKEAVRKNIDRGLILVDISGTKVGQINGLSVVSVGQFLFGQPMRITATARLGRGELIDIERESKMGGNIHSKAMMIVSSFIGSRYAQDRPLSLRGSLVFEQSYGGVEGDSASIAEVCALLSAISECPIRQNLAITGSMDQHGKVQAIGGVNDKIEGFFDICLSQGLTGEHGVIIPESNREHLMLREDVVEAVKNKQFHIHTVTTIDDAMSLLFSEKPLSSIDVKEVHKCVIDRLDHWHNIRLNADKEAEEKSTDIESTDIHEND